ncbi:hypothetical protein BDBG_03582 [Blastomyces gilchristii SLH14081]|uniref:DUF7905 domain-containing protein n=1 Tax=Blastomyces gilchristii (strain SLH14081) TaxID=559298 RepID=A0A179UMA9_BLAGS|nr:uncharacterized protein BDBG_03582 [Blastomyces gilchristii SLH14081]OAT07532.1 hypothetical protein BDBG_03582 [Blastomyces gilchristii SLH14081]
MERFLHFEQDKMAQYELRAARGRLNLEDQLATPRSTNPVRHQNIGTAPHQQGIPNNGPLNHRGDSSAPGHRGARGGMHGGRGTPVWVRGRGAYRPSRANFDHARGSNHRQYPSARPVDNSDSLQPNARKKEDHFAKISRYVKAKEIRNDINEKRQLMIEQYRQKPDPSIKIPETMLFLWPDDELPLEMALGKDLEALDPIRAEFGYYIYLYDESPDGQKYIRVDGGDHGKIIEIVQRLRAKWANLLAETSVKTKLYLVQAPTVDIFKAEVGLMKCRQPGSQNIQATPFLYGAKWDDAELEQCHQLRKKNEQRLRNAVDQSLDGLRFLAGHVRMRINFGKFVLENYRVPPNSKELYSFEEFRSMLFYAGTKGRLIPGLGFKSADGDLMTRCSQASDLLAPFDPQIESLENNKPHYAVNIEFEGANNALLRLEVEFESSRYRPNLFEISHRRWLKPQSDDGLGEKRPPLQIGVIDFERSDWQLEIKALDFQEQSNIEQSLKSFDHSIQFKRGPTDGLRGTAVQRVTFSNIATVSKITEKSALRYRLKGTKYIFELARYDTYHRAIRPGPPSIGDGNKMNQTAETTWGASIFRQEWDNMLGQNGSFRVGQTADWSASLNTFFPCLSDEDSTDVNTGFHQFIDLVNKVAKLLTPERKSEVVERAETTPCGNIKPVIM